MIGAARRECGGETRTLGSSHASEMGGESEPVGECGPEDSGFRAEIQYTRYAETRLKAEISDLDRWGQSQTPASSG